MKEVNFLDRVPTHPGRVVLNPVPGQANTYDMVRADEPVVVGTPLDKATYDSMVYSRLTGRYYELAHTLTQVSSVTGLTANPIPASGWTVADGVATNGGYTATTLNNDEDVVEVFDPSTTGISTLNKAAYWVQIELPQSIIVKKVRIRSFTINTGVIATTQVQGSNNGDSWDTLGTISGNLEVATEVTLSKTGEYKYYRLFVTTPVEATIRVYDFGFTSYDVKTYSMAYATPAGWPTVWTKGQRVTVQIPSDAKTGAVVANTIAGIPCATILRVNRRYELRYDGSAFAAKEV